MSGGLKKSDRRTSRQALFFMNTPLQFIRFYVLNIPEAGLYRNHL